MSTIFSFCYGRLGCSVWYVLINVSRSCTNRNFICRINKKNIFSPRFYLKHIMLTAASYVLCEIREASFFTLRRYINPSLAVACRKTSPLEPIPDLLLRAAFGGVLSTRGFETARPPSCAALSALPTWQLQVAHGRASGAEHWAQKVEVVRNR